MRKLLLVLPVLLIGCTTTGNIGDTDIQRELDVSCRAIGTSLSAIAPHWEKLNESQQKVVLEVRDRSEPICYAPDAPKTGETLNMLLVYRRQIEGVEAEVK
jgi:hypothetical protein